MRLRSGKVKKNRKVANKNEVIENEKIIEIELENKLSKNKLRGKRAKMKK